MIPDIAELNFPEYATLHEATCQMQDMGEHTISTQLRLGAGVVPDFGREWAVAFDGAKYVSRQREPQADEDNELAYATADLTFRHWAEEELKRWFFFTVQPVEAGTAIPDKYEASVDLNLGDFCVLFGQVLNHYYGDKIRISLNPAWEYDAEPVRVEISKSYCWDVLLKIYELYGVRWEILPDGDMEHYVIAVGYATQEIDHIFEHGFEGGLLKVSRQPQSEEIKNIFLGRGGTKNIPTRYFKDTDPANPGFAPDPDWIPELANIYFGELRGATFRSYIQGWKARHYNDGEHGDITAPKAEDAYAPWAWMRGYTDESFNPVEYTADGFTTAKGGYGIKPGSSIDRYGELMDGLDNNEDYYPTLQGVRSGDHLKFFGSDFRRVDEAVWVEQLTTDEVRNEAPNDAEKTSLAAMSGSVTLAGNERKELILESGYITVPTGKRGDFEPGNRTLSGDNGTVTVESATTEAIDDAGKVIAATGIPAGRCKARVRLSLYNTGTGSVTVNVSYPSPALTTATPDEWRDTFDILIKNVWGSSKKAGETDAEYAERVWGPILGNRDGEEAKVVFSDGALAASEDYEFVIVATPTHEEKTCEWETTAGSKVVKHTFTSHWRIRLGRSNADYDTLGVMVPGRERNGKAGDHFFFTGIDLPHPYALWAEESLDDWKQDVAEEKGTARPTWVVTPDKVRLGTLQPGEQHTLLSQLKAGKSVTLQSRRFIGGSQQERLYLQSVTLTYKEPTDDDPYLIPDIEVVLGNDYTVSANPVERVAGEVRAIRNQIGNLSNVGQEVRRVGDRIYLRKDVSDRTPYPLNVGGALTAEEWLLVGKFISGLSGAGIDAFGNAEVESMTVRSFLRIYELIVNRQRTFDSDIMLTEGDTVESVVPFGLSSEGLQRFTLKLREEWEGYTTALYEADVLRGIYNELAQPGNETVPGATRKNGALYFTVWLRVLAVRPLQNEVDVVMYADEDCPAQHNFEPREMLKICRWGNAGETEAQKQRQRVIYLSSSEGSIMLLDHVTKPIIDKGNIVAVMGRLPMFIADYDMDFKPGDHGIYVNKIYAGHFQQIGHAGYPDPVIYYRGDWDPDERYYDGTIQGPVDPTGVTGPVVAYEKSQVGYMGCQWVCNKTGTKNTPTWDSIDWTLYVGDPRLHLEFDSPDSVVDIESPDLILGVVASINNQDVTTHPDMRYDWSRRSVIGETEDTASDAAWTAAHQNIGPTVHLLREDMNYAFGRPPDELVYTVLATLDPSQPSPQTEILEITL